MKKIIFFLLACAAFGSLSTVKGQVMDSPRDGIYDKINSINRKPIPYTALRQADVVWEKRVWRAIDLRQKMNHVFYYPETPYKGGWQNFMTTVMEALKEGTINAYQVNLQTDEFTTLLTYEQLMKTLNKIDTVQERRPYPPYDLFDTIKVVEFSASDVKMLRLKEVWFFDKQRSQMDVRIVGICPVKDNYDESNNFRAREPMFWLYFPELRPLLAKTEVFNRNNDAERRTYDDIFWKRMFDSYIYKEQNVYDRKIADYAQGLDALLESERIKTDLFKIEHDLWEF